MSYATLIRAIHLQEQANALIIRQKLPALVRRLIHATVDKPTLTRFPADEGIDRRGWDGMVENTLGNAWVPTGRSVWEMGTAPDSKGKANEDYNKRTAEPGRIKPPETAFVFVTPRKWEGKMAWCDARRSESVWKDVIALDSADLEEWLEHAPAVDLWLARLLDKLPPAGLRDPLGRWHDLAAISVPPLTPEIFLCNRREMVAVLRKAILGPPHEFAVATTSSQELVDFACAVLESSDEEMQDAAARALIINNPEAWSQLVTMRGCRLFLIPGDQLEVDKRMVAEAVNAGHSVLTARPYTYLRAGTTMPRLPRVPPHELQQALETAGFASARAARLAQASAGCLVVLVRLSSQFVGQSVPAWARADAAGELLPLLLLGEWDDASENDRQCVERLAGESYDVVRQRITYWLQQPDGPLRLVEGVCGFFSREESWLHLAPLLTRDLLDKFTSLALEVLCEDDPRFDMPVGERHMAGVRKREPRYSFALRGGVAETLALLGARGENTPQGSSQGSAWRAAQIVEQLLGGNAGARPQRWFALAPLLPTLAEAAPDEFLDALIADLDREQPAVTALFPSPSDTPDPWFNATNYTGLLWALQRLGWSHELLSRTALALVALVKRDFQFKSSPTPGSVLHAVFALWCPHTDANEADRCQVLDLIVAREPSLAWKLLLGLIPDGHGFIIGGEKPRIRDWGMVTPPPITNVDLWRQIEWVGDRLVTLAQGNVERWLELLDEVQKLPLRVRHALLAWLRSFEAAAIEPEARLQLWTTLRKTVVRHRFYHESNWSLAENIVDELAEAEARFAPDDPALRYAWLFEGYCSDCFGDLATPQEERTKMAAEARRQAIDAILRAGGSEKVFALAKSVGFPGQVGVVLAEVGIVLDSHKLLPSLLLDAHSNIRVFARCYAVQVAATPDAKGLKVFPLEEWPEEAVAEVMAFLPLARITWEELRRRRPTAEAFYWQKAFLVGSQLDAHDLEEAVEMLRRNGRVFDAADIMTDGVRRFHQPHWELVAELIEEVLRKSAEIALPQQGTVSIHDLCELMQYLQDALAAEPSSVARLEWNFLPLAHNGPFTPKFLHGEMSSNPAFFVEVLTHRFPLRSEKEDDTAESTQSDARTVAVVQMSFHLLQSWRQIPGRQPDGSVDRAGLQTWLAETRRLCAVVNRVEIGDVEIGELLAHAPSEPDGTWPCIPVREALESVRTDEILRGFKIGVFNTRGLVSKTLTEGGEQERKLAAHYRQHADHCRARWPYTARALRDLAESYERSARSEDERAEGRD